MNRVWMAVVLACALPVASSAQEAPAAAELTELLKAFLSGVDDPVVHEAFWADDLIYTRSSGVRIGKADILRDMRAAPPPAPEDPMTVYTPEDIHIQQYGNMAIVAFRLVGTTEKDGNKEVVRYLNTGTFLKRNETWQAVAWQATRMVTPEADAEREVVAAQSQLLEAMLAPDTKAVGALLDDSFLWTQGVGKQVNGRDLIEQLGSGSLKYVSLSSKGVMVSLHGDTGVVRGIWSGERVANPGGVADAGPQTGVFTLVLVRAGGAWKAVALHSSEP